MLFHSDTHCQWDHSCYGVSKTGTNMISRNFTFSRPTSRPAASGQTVTWPCNLESKRAEGEPDSQPKYFTSKHWYEVVLGLAGMELAFFIAAHMVPRFGFVTKTVLVTYQSFSYHWAMLAQGQGFLCSSLCPLGAGWGGQDAGRGTAGRADLKYPKGYRDFPSHLTSRSAIKLRKASLQMTAFQNSYCLETDWALRKWLPLHHYSFFSLSSPTKLYLSQPSSFLTFTLPVLTPVTLTGGTGQAAGWGFSC